ncbi:MAG TPA: hypothetical protein VG994_02135 [Steroidobacteraceae bacterium]|nr:hypothetical protein [Steroidobacteraceae bacterium]
MSTIPGALAAVNPPPACLHRHAFQTFVVNSSKSFREIGSRARRYARADAPAQAVSVADYWL